MPAPLGEMPATRSGWHRGLLSIPARPGGRNHDDIMQIVDHPIPTSPISPVTDDMAAALRQAIRRSGLTLERISTHLAARGHRVSRTTLSNWQRGHVLPRRRATMAALRELETLLGLESGVLHVDEPERPAYEGSERGALVAGFETVSAHERHILGADGFPVRPRCPQAEGLSAQEVRHKILQPLR